MAVDLSAIQTNVTNIANVILVTPDVRNGSFKPEFKQNQQVGKGVPTLVFHIDEENTVQLSSDITDHYVENNTSIQDHIALKPETVTVNGYIGELNDVTPDVLQPLKFVADKLTTLQPFVPVISAAAVIAYNQAAQAYAIAQLVKSNAISAYNSIAGNTVAPAQNKQQQMFNQLLSYWSTKTLFTVQTPWCKFENMAMVGMRAVQDADTRMITDFELSFKKIRFATTIIRSPSSRAQGRLKSLSSSLVDHGIVQATQVDKIVDRLSSSGLA